MTCPLDQALLDAHDRADSDALVSLYHQAAQDTADDAAAGFYLTHAYVFALEAADQRADLFRQQLIGMGRDTAS